MTPGSGSLCRRTATVTTQALNTAWFTVPTRGRPLRAEIGGFEPLIATRYEYGETTRLSNPLACSWKVLQTPIDTFSLDEWPGATGVTHVLQIGRCKQTDTGDPGFDHCGGQPLGEVELSITTTPPPNDDRADAATVGPTSGQQLFDNHSSDMEPPE